MGGMGVITHIKKSQFHMGKEIFSITDFFLMLTIKSDLSYRLAELFQEKGRRTKIKKYKIFYARADYSIANKKKSFAKFIITIFTVLISSCSSLDLTDTSFGENYSAYFPNIEDIGKLTEQDIIEKVGEPTRREVGESNVRLHFIYSDKDARNDGISRLSWKVSSYIFEDGRLALSYYTSSFYDDSTYFKLNDAESIKLGDTYESLKEKMGGNHGVGKRMRVHTNEVKYLVVYHYLPVESRVQIGSSKFASYGIDENGQVVWSKVNETDL